MTASALRRPLAVLVLLACLAVVAVTLRASDSQAAAPRKCSLSQRDQDPPGDKPTYNLSLKATGSSCTTAKKVMVAFHRCRSAASFTCKKKVLSIWACTGRRSSSTPLLFYASFTCRAGARRVTSSYQQNT